MDIEIEQKYEKTLDWLSGYIDGILENENVKKNQLEKMISKLSEELEMFDSFDESEAHDDLPF